jgi:hypothetical protein
LLESLCNIKSYSVFPDVLEANIFTDGICSNWGLEIGCGGSLR